jgi:hypothetical protein
MFVHDGKLWGTKEVLADKLNRSIDVIRRRIIVNDLQSLEGITRGGAARPFYMLDEVKRPAPNEATVRSRMGYTPVNAELLKLYADELVSAFFALRKKMPDLKSDMLWSAIKKKWYAPDLDRALKKAKRGDLKAFRQLLAE